MDALLQSLKAGEPALLATDTVYGVAALPGTPGIDAIFKLKERPAAQALPWLVAGEDWLDRYGVEVSAYVRKLAAAFWPGALTLVVKASPAALKLGGLQQDGTVALRCPNNDTCLELLRALDAPLACTSANVHGQPAPSRLEQVEPRFLQLAHAPNIAASCPAANASTVVDCTGPQPRILREGAIHTQNVTNVARHDAKLECYTFTAENREDLMGSICLSIGSDHGGFEQKEQLRAWLEESGYQVIDRGCNSEESVDYPDYAALVGQDVASGVARFGVLVCGTGIGIGIAANKIKGIRAANVTTRQFAQLAREHNDANIVSLSGRFVDLDTNKEIVETFLTTQHLGGRHTRRVTKIMQLEER